MATRVVKLRDSTESTPEPEQANPQRKRAEAGRYLLQVDRQTKGSYETAELAQAAGLTIKTVLWAFTTGEQGNWWSEGPAFSADGRFVAFASQSSNLVPGDFNFWPDIFVRDLVSGETNMVSLATEGTQGNGDSFHPVLSPDARYVAFGSSSPNLVPGNTKPRQVHRHLSRLERPEAHHLAY